MFLFRHPVLLLRRSEALQTAPITVAFWTLAVIALTSLRDLHLWGMPQVEVVIARATMACIVILVGLVGLVGIRCLFAWRKSGSRVSVLSTVGGMPGVLLLGAVASYLAIGFAVMDEADWRPGTAESLRFAVLSFGVLVAAVVGGRAVLERVGADRLLRGVLVVLILSCAIILASPVLRDLGILPPYRIPFRLTGAFVDPNDASLIGSMTVGLAAAFLTNGGPRTLGWVGLAAGVAASLGSASRTALVILGALAIVFLLIHVRSKPRAFVLILAATVMVAIGGLAGVAFFSGGLSEWFRARSGINDALGEKLFCDPSPTDSPGTDCAVLLATRDILAGDIALNWSRTVPVNRWRGVTVEGPEGHVTGLHLAGLGLNGRIPPDLGRLDRLVSLSLGRNRLTGRIPPELGNLASLKYLVLSYNILTGAIPPELANLENLKELWLRNNRLTGHVPAALAGLDLSVLRLSGNDFDSIPPKINAVADHDLGRFVLCLPPPRTSPALFEDCTTLLAVKDTLAGDAPLDWHAAVSIGLWQGVTVGGPEGRVIALDLYGKGLNGRIPPSLGRLDGLVSLNLAANRLTGSIPPELGQLVDLRVLALDRNALTGTVPAELARLPGLRALWLKENRLTGPVSPALFDVPDHDLGRLVLCLPPPRTSPALFEDCTTLLAAKDTLAGDAPLDWHAAVPIGLWQGVTVGGPEGRVIALDLYGKGLNGRIPPRLSGLDGLVSLNLAANRLTGSIPPELGQLVDLRVLALDRNALTGTVPAELARLPGLRALWLKENRLTGPVSPALFDVPDHDLGRLVLCLPPPRTSPALFEDCTTLLAAKDTLAGDAPLDWHAAVPIGLWQGVTVGGPEGRVIALDLYGKGLNGRIPPRLGRLDGLVSLNLAANRLTGSIPPELGSLAGLRSLVLDGNALTGAIPPELGKLTDLERLGLAKNALIGPIPPELAKLSSLGKLWLSGNRLTGFLPPELRAVAGRDAPCPAAPADNPGLRADCALLLAARDILAGDAPLGWSEDIPIEIWQGVTVGGSPERVTRLDLSRSGLNGRIPPALGGLDKLVSLWLNRNRLTGPVPPELGELTDLEVLTLSFNALSGPIPPELGKLSHLRELWLKHNRLTGSVPPELEGLEKLTLIRLFGNDLERPYPRRLYRIASHDLDLHDLRHRRSLDDAEAAQAADRRMNRDRPDAVRRLFCRPSSSVTSDLQADCGLLLANKDVLAGDAALDWSEDIPIEFWQGVTVGGSPKRVTALALPRAGLNGRLFAELGELGGLVALDLSHNRLAGPVPPELEGLGNLFFLRLAGNDLNRPFPPALHEIADHDLDGPVFCRPKKIDPDLLADCTLLLTVRDSLAGDAPLNWRRDVPVDDWQGVAVDRSRGRVTALDLTQMGLNGRIPAELGQLAGLASLRLGRNRLAGDIPPELGNLAGLRMLALDGNLLAGSVPPELGKLSRLTDLRLHGNRLSGPAPPAVAALPALRLDDDDAVGELPAQSRGRVLDRNLFCQSFPEAL